LKEIQLIERMHRKKILIVEDYLIIAVLVKEILEIEGFEVEVASDGVEGLEKIMQNRYDVIISDFVIPQIKGSELYLEVKKLSPDLAKRIIFISGIITDFIKSTGNRFLMKPFSHKQLVEVVRELIPSDM
jgi:DNA-binding response OmpR family regulator